jgi:phage gp36-like protein
MAYLVKADLETHIYPEIIKRIIRDYSTSYANLAAFPATGVAGKKYIATDTGLTYIWNDTAYEQVAATDLVTSAIDAAIAEAKSYLGKYNLDTLFDDSDDDFVDDPNLLTKVKDIACWHLVKLANPNVNLAMFRTAYEDAIAWLEKIMKAQMDPAGWIYKTDDDDTNRVEGQGFFSTSNSPRTNHY